MFCFADAERLFARELNRCFIEEGFHQVSVDLFPNRYKALYKLDHHDLRGLCVSSSTIEVNGIPCANALACYARVVDTDCPLYGGESVRVKLPVKCSIEKMREQFKVNFINRIKDLFTSGMEELPIELLFRLLNYLSVVDLVKLSQVNKRLYQAINDNYFWKRMYQIYYGFDGERSMETDWKELFKKAYIEQKALKETFERLQDLYGRSLPASTILLALPPPQSLIMAPPLLPIPALPHFNHHHYENALLWYPYNENA